MNFTKIQNPREAANTLFKTISDTLSPVLRESKLKECLILYNESIYKSTDLDGISSSHKNMGVTFIKLFK